VVDAATGVIRTETTVDRDSLCPGAVDCLLRLDVVAVHPINPFRIVRVDVSYPPFITLPA